LLVLVKNPGKLLEREQLMQAVWADTFVEDANLTVAISHLGKVLGQSGDPADYLETIPRVS
jgi:DNA-binding winged helix-turn-helix (wHTH) protein